MKSLYILSAVFMAMLVVVVYSEDTPIEPIPKECPKKDSVNATVNIAHETNCSLFYSCQHGKKILLVCPKLNKEGDRLFFNPKLQVCDWPENVKCENKPQPGEGEGEGEGEAGEGEGGEAGEGEGGEAGEGEGGAWEGEGGEAGEGEGGEAGEGEGGEAGEGEGGEAWEGEGGEDGEYGEGEGEGEGGKVPPPVRDNILSRMWMNRV